MTFFICQKCSRMHEALEKKCAGCGTEDSLIASENGLSKAYSVVRGILNANESLRTNPNQLVLKDSAGNRVFGLGVAYPQGQYILFSNGEAREIQPEKLPDGRSVYRFGFADKYFDVETSMEQTNNQLSKEGLKRFVSGEKINPAAHFSSGLQILKKYSCLDEESYKYLIAWIQHTYWLAISGQTQYVMFVGKPGTGKTVITRLLAKLAFKGEFFVSPSPAAVYRLVQANMPTICMDEFDKQNKERMLDIAAIYNSGYTADAFVVRCGEDGKLDRFQTFSAKSLNGNDYATIDSVRSRLLEITTQPTNRKLRDVNTLSALEQDELSRFRDDCWLLALQEWQTFEKQLDSLKEAAQSQRSDVIHLPIVASLAVLNASDVGLVSNWAKAASDELQEAISASDYDTFLVRMLITKAGDNKGLKISPKELAEELTKILHEEGVLPEDWTLKPRKVGEMLKKLGLNKRENRVRENGIRFIELSKENLDELCRRFPRMAPEGRKDATLATFTTYATLETGVGHDKTTPNPPTYNVAYVEDVVNVASKQAI